MRWENWTAIAVAMGIAFTLQLASGARFDDPMTSLLESIRDDGGPLQAMGEPRIWPASAERP